MRPIVVSAAIILLVQIACEIVLWILPGTDIPEACDSELSRGWYVAGSAWLILQFLCAWVVVHAAVWGL